MFSFSCKPPPNIFSSKLPPPRILSSGSLRLSFYVPKEDVGRPNPPPPNFLPQLNPPVPYFCLLYLFGYPPPYIFLPSRTPPPPPVFFTSSNLLPCIFVFFASSGTPPLHFCHQEPPVFFPLKYPPVFFRGGGVLQINMNSQMDMSR